nr:ubiquitin carboxyl-terminal hydrolase 8 [Cryptococcus depauperatus CBS 7841]
MARPQTPTNFAGVPLTQLLQYVPNDTAQLSQHPPKYWFDRACYYSDKAKLAEKRQFKEEVFVNYMRSCNCYINCISHPDYPAFKISNQTWANRVKDFKPIYETYVSRGKALKSELRQEETARSQARPQNVRQQSGPETSSIGNLKDRMNALAGHGMSIDTVQPKRASRELPVKAAKPATLSTVNQTAGRTRSESVKGLPTTTSTNNGKQFQTTASSKPSIELSPLSPSSATQINGQPAGLSTRSRTSTNERHGLSSSLAALGDSGVPPPGQSLTPLSNNIHMKAEQTHPPLPLAGNSASPLSQPTHRSQLALDPLQSHSTNRLAEFERSFPSLLEFGKQWDSEPDYLPNPYSPTTGATPTANGDGKYAPNYPTISEETALNLPNLPSVPLTKPGLPQPPSQPELFSFPTPAEPTPTGRISPPKADVGTGFGLHRPASTPNITNLSLDDREAAEKEPMSKMNDTKMDFPIAVPTPPRGEPSSLPARGLPVPQPVPSQSQPTQWASQQSALGKMEKPKFPFSNSVSPPQLREYFLNPSVSMLFLDVRNPSDWERNGERRSVGKEYEVRTGKKVEVVGVDPTILDRPDMTPSKLEDALSLSPPEQQKYFSLRHTYDLIVIYDTSSSMWPSPPHPVGRAPPLARLWDMFFMGHDDGKRLKRNPVLLIGGYEGWREFIKMRSERHAQARGKANEKKPRDEILPQSAETKRTNRDLPVYQPGQYSKTITENVSCPIDEAKRHVLIIRHLSSHLISSLPPKFTSGPQSMIGESSYGHTHSQSQSYAPNIPLAYQHSRTGSSYSTHGAIAALPQASIHPGPGARRRSDYVEHNGQAYSGTATPVTSPPAPSASSGAYYTSPPPPSTAGIISSRQSIDYPQAHALAKVPVPMPPPAAARPMDRTDYASTPMVHSGSLNNAQGPGVIRSNAVRGLDRAANGYDGYIKNGFNGNDRCGYWQDVVLGITGLKNLGNTCYMNSTIQCLSATYPFSTFFLDGTFAKSINKENPLGTKGELAKAWAELLRVLWSEKYEFLSPITFRKQITHFAPQFLGTDQHDSQEFLSFVLDGLHEDLNRIKQKPPPVEMTPEREQMLEKLPPEVASESEWSIYRQRNDSLIVDLFQGQYRNRLECLTCHKASFFTSTTYDTFMYMSLPVPTGKSKAVIQELIDEFVKPEVIEKEDAWYCPRCKAPRRASKTLTIARLPPVLLIQLKRFTTKNGIFWDKSETPVIFPVKSLDLTRYVPGRQNKGNEDLHDPRAQVGPFKYDLYGVSNHMGTLSSGHYTAFVKSKEGWKYCEDSKVSQANESHVVVSV